MAPPQSFTSGKCDDWELQQTDLLKVPGELPHHVGRVFSTNPKRDHCADIAQDGMPNVGLKLMQVLVSYREPDAIDAILA
jgi:hypothetical protein